MNWGTTAVAECMRCQFIRKKRTQNICDFDFVFASRLLRPHSRIPLSVLCETSIWAICKIENKTFETVAKSKLEVICMQNSASMRVCVREGMHIDVAKPKLIFAELVARLGVRLRPTFFSLNIWLLLNTNAANHKRFRNRQNLTIDFALQVRAVSFETKCKSYTKSIVEWKTDLFQD